MKNFFPGVLGFGTLICSLLLFVWPALGQSKAESPSITLKSATIRDFSFTPPPPPAEITPAFKEKSFNLKEAANYREIRALVGPLTPEQERYLEKNRFLLLPKAKYLAFRRTGQGVYDEMLANFDGLGGSQEQHLRAPQNARFVGPDVFLHALAKYYHQRVAAVEAGPLSQATEFMLSGLYEHAVALKDAAGRGAAGSWERLLAQLAVPLILLQNSPETSNGAPGASPPPADTLENALKLFESYRPDFSKAMAGKMKTELERIYKAETAAVGLLGLVPADGSERIDYRLFRPVGRGAGQARNRAYFRAMAWLGGLGWSTGTREGLTDALNCSLAMSYEPAPARADQADGSPKISELRVAVAPAENAAPREPANIRQAWARVMEINTFLLGYPDAPSYLEWLPFLMKEAVVSEFRVDTSADPAVMDRLAAAAGSIAAAPPHFRDLRPGGEAPVIAIFPRRFTLAGLITEQLTYEDGRNEEAPVMFSGLWVPALLGQKYARDQVPRQLAGASGGDPLVLEDGSLRELIKLSAANLTGRMDTLSARLRAEPQAHWSSSFTTTWIRVLATLTAEPGQGHPEYQRSPAFPAKRVETILGAYTEMRHDPSLETLPGPEKTAPPIAEEEAPAPLVKGFVEPNPAFWREMTGAVQMLAAGWREFGLFPEDLAEMGALPRFQKRLERCAAISAKELTGEELTDDDYEFIRLFTLDWMAAPPGRGDHWPADPEVHSAALAPVQGFTPEGGSPSLVYEGNGEPALMLVLVGNEKSPRLTVGLAYDHYEFVAPRERPLDDEAWRRIVYRRHSRNATAGDPDRPAKNFWYDPLRP